MLSFIYGSMSSGKTLSLLAEAHNLKLHNKRVFLLTAAIDSRSGFGKISSRVGLSAEAETYSPGEDLFAKVAKNHAEQPIERVMVDEAQWLSRDQVWQLSDVADDLGIGVTCFGLRNDFRGDLFEGSAALMSIADELKENTGVCPSGARATMVARLAKDGFATLEGPQVLVGGEETYAAMSRKRWKQSVRDGEAQRRAHLRVVSG